MKRLFTALMLIALVLPFQSCENDDCPEPCTQMAFVLRERDRRSEEIPECQRESELGLQFIRAQVVEIDCQCELPFKYVRYSLNQQSSMKLFKKDTKGKIRMLLIYAEGDEVVQISGLVDGEKTENRSKSTAKNIGRANETTAQEQAILEADAKITKKLAEGYFPTEDEAKNEVVEKPMLAKDAKKMLHRIQYPCFIQPKLDGMRCLSNVAFPMTSRTNREIDTLPHIKEEVMMIGEKIDGELYAHGKTFQENISLIKKYRGGESESIKYHVYDMAMDAPFETRYRRLADRVKDMEHIELVKTIIVGDEEELRKHHAQFIEQGYEGTIIRHTDDGYKFNGRSSSLLKFKDFIDEAYTIIDVIPLEARPDQGQYVCEMPNGNTFKAMLKGSFEYRREVLENKSEHIGKVAEVRFFEYTDEGLPRFPVAHGIRLDK